MFPKSHRLTAIDSSNSSLHSGQQPQVSSISLLAQVLSGTLVLSRPPVQECDRWFEQNNGRRRTTYTRIIAVNWPVYAASRTAVA